MAAEPGLLGGNNACPGVHARETAAQQPDPLGEVRRDLEAVLKLIQATRAPVLGRKKANKFVHTLEAARREVRRALEAAGSGPA